MNIITKIIFHTHVTGKIYKSDIFRFGETLCSNVRLACDKNTQLEMASGKVQCSVFRYLRCAPGQKIAAAESPTHIILVLKKKC